MSTMPNRLITILLALSLTAGAEIASAQAKAGCEGKIIAMATSHDDVWVALTEEKICRDGYFVTIVSGSIQLVKSDSIDKVLLGLHPDKPEHENDVLTVDEGEHPENRPITRWLSARKLQITIPNKSIIGLKKEKYDEVELVIKYEPDDPVERERWRKSVGLPPK